MRTYILNSENAKLVGRYTYDEDMVLWCAMSGSGAQFHFKGSKLSVTFVGDNSSERPEDHDNYARYAVYENDTRIAEGILDKIKKTVEFERDIDADITVIKLSECAMSTLGIAPVECEGEITPVPEKKLKAEFIGDSITCGYGVDDEIPEHNFCTSSEDCTKAYAYKTAKALDADYSLFSISGWGIISGYTEDDTAHTEQILPRYYKKVGFSYEKFDDRDGFAPQDVNWDFKKYVPDIVVINLGTNDSSYCHKKEDRSLEYAKKYTEFLHTVHECNPNAKILCCLGLMDECLYDYVEKAAADFKAESGFDEVYTLRLSRQDEKYGYAVSWHPVEKNHEIAAREVTAKIKEILAL